MRHRVLWYVLVVTGSLAYAMTLILVPTETFPWGVSGLAAFAVGAVLTRRVSDNPIGWLLLAFGYSGAISFLLLPFFDNLDPGIYAWAEAVFYAVSSMGVMVLPVVLLRFPNGSLPSPRWRYVEWAAIVGALTGSTASMLNGGWGGDREQAQYVSPLYGSTEPLGDVLSTIFFALFLLTFVVAAISLIVRYRRSSGEQRLQIKFIAYASGFLLFGLAMVLADSGFETVQTDTVWESVLMAAAFASIPVSIGLAILRYRLYDIDVVISRTLVLGALAVFITATYALVVVGIGHIIGGDADGLLLPIAATAIVAVAFEPVRVRTQRWANRLVYGQRATPYEVLSDLTERLSTAHSDTDLLDRVAELLREGTGAESATVWLGSSGAMVAAASSPAESEPSELPESDEVASFPVSHGGQVIGALEVRKPKGTVLSTAERSLITDLAGSAGALLGYQRLNDSLAANAQELEESRARLVGAQDQERRRLERELHEGAEQYIVALKVKLGVASQLAGKQGADGLVQLLNGLTAESQAALDDVQNLAKGIYPPILESDGLGAAVSALAASTPVEVLVERDGVGRYPIDIEAAVYFDISEAVTNAVKHAEAPIAIELAESAGTLHFSVRDSGPGFELDTHEPGSGLENMADRMSAVGGRLRVVTSLGSYTEVSGSVPVHTEVNTDGSNSDLETKATAPAASALD